MFKLDLNSNDKKWLRNKYPDLTIVKENGMQVVFGDLHFDAIYQDERITDTYAIRIKMQRNALSDLPSVSETASRIMNVSKERNIPLADLHAYEDGTACLCVRLDEASYFPNGFSFPTFMEKLVIPFFYAQSYFERFSEWPWEVYSHGVLGWIEWYHDQEDVTPEIADDLINKLKTTKRGKRMLDHLRKHRGIKGHHHCICGSRKRFRNCHNKVFRGLWELYRDANEFGIEI